MLVELPELIKLIMEIVRNKLKFKTDLNKSVLLENFEERGWTEVPDSDDNWNMYWTCVNSVRDLFYSSTKLNDRQLVNHFPNYYELTRKDYMAKNIKKYKRHLLKDNRSLNVDYLDFIPTTFILPSIIKILKIR